MAKRKILLLGKSSRLDCMAAALRESSGDHELIILSDVRNSSLEAKGEVREGNSADWKTVLKVVQETKPDLAVIGPEEPLEAEIPDRLEERQIKCFGPRSKLAKIETSKAFARDLVAQHIPHLNPRFRVFEHIKGVREFLRELDGFVVKPDGLTGGKGVRVSGEHLNGVDAGVEYCREVIGSGGRVVIEEKLDGEEFSLQSFTDGTTTVATIPVQDHKRAYNDDTGPNTGGMGSYSCSDHLLPFLDRDTLAEAERANSVVAQVLSSTEVGPYRGILYGGFMLTAKGLKLIEYNARFGDPEAMNVLPLLDCDFLEICDATVAGRLGELSIQFARKATVCKYVVPTEYPDRSADAVIDVPRQTIGEDKLRTYFGAVRTDELGRNHLAQSRSVAFVGIANTLDEAEQIAEKAASSVRGPVRHRSDIGTAALIQKRVQHMEKIRSKKRASAA